MQYAGLYKDHIMMAMVQLKGIQQLEYLLTTRPTLFPTEGLTSTAKPRHLGILRRSKNAE